MKLAAAVGIALTLALPGAWATGTRPVLGIDARGGTAHLATFDPVTLAKLPGRAPSLGRYVALSSLSPGRTRLASAPSARTLRIVDVARMRVAGDVGLEAAGTIRQLEWASGERLVVGRQDDDGHVTVDVIDAASRRVIRQLALAAASFASARFAGGVAFALLPSERYESATVAIVDVDGNLRTVKVDVLAGSKTQPDGRLEVREPGLAADPAGRRVYVVDTDFSVAEIDVDSLAVTYHRPGTRSLAKFALGKVRTARWLGAGVLGVSGFDLAGTYPGTPAGLRLVDTRRWTWKIVDPTAESFQAGTGVLVAEPASTTALRRRVTAYGFDGSRRYALDLQRNRGVTVAGGYVYVCHGRGVLRVLDAATGARLRAFTREPLPDCPRFLS